MILAKEVSGNYMFCAWKKPCGLLAGNIIGFGLLYKNNSKPYLLKLFRALHL